MEEVKPKRVRGKGSPYDKWCFLRSSQKLRSIIKLRLEKEGVKPYRIARLAGTRGELLKEYLNGVDKSMTQYSLWKICQQLGIEIELGITFTEPKNYKK